MRTLTFLVVSVVLSMLVADVGSASAADSVVQDQGNPCAGSPKEAVMDLPDPLSVWGRLVCTRYGHVITANKGWIWTRPGAFSPIFLPAQMVQKKPAELGNKSYFTKISLTEVETDASEFQKPWTAFSKIFPNDPFPANTFRLDLTSVSGKTLQLYFLAFEAKDEKHPGSLWGMACSQSACDSKSAFLLLDMRRATPPKPDNDNK